MNKDIRLSTEFLSHPKTIKLIRATGADGVLCLLRLWIWAAQNRTDGMLVGLDTEDLEIIANWNGENGAFVATLERLRFLDVSEKGHALHGWSEHQEYVCQEQARIEKARKAANKRWGNVTGAAGSNPQKENGHCHTHGTGIPRACSEHGNNTSVECSKHTSSMSQACHEHAASMLVEMPQTNPNQTKPEENKTTPNGVVVDDKPSTPPPCPHSEIIAIYHEALPELPKVKTWTGTRQRHLQARWRDRWQAGKYSDTQSGLAYWRRLMLHVRDCPWLMGQITGKQGDAFKASLAWLVLPENFAKLIEGKYDRREQ